MSLKASLIKVEEFNLPADVNKYESRITQMLVGFLSLWKFACYHARTSCGKGWNVLLKK